MRRWDPLEGPVPLRPVAANELRSPDDFGTIADRDERSRAIFVEATRVMLARIVADAGTIVNLERVRSQGPVDR